MGITQLQIEKRIIVRLAGTMAGRLFFIYYPAGEQEVRKNEEISKTMSTF